MKITKWSPDSCKCVIEYEWDETVPDVDRVHYYKNTVKTCLIHKGLVTTELYDALKSETTRKNKVQGFIEQNISNATETIIDDIGETQKVLKRKALYIWSFTGSGKNRILHISLTGVPLTEADKTQIRNFASAEFGSDKMVMA